MTARLFSWSMIFVLGCSPLGFAATATLKNVGVYAVDNVVLENEYLRLEIDPRKGARIISFFCKTSGKEYSDWRRETKEGGDGGLLRDLAPGLPHPGEFKDAPFQFEILSPGPGEAVARFYCDGKQTNTKGLRFAKTLRLKEGSRLLEVQLEIKNTGYGPQTIDWRIHNMLAPAGAWEPGRDFCFLPTPEGVTEMSGTMDSKKTNKFVTDFTAGWMAIIDQDKQEGFVAIANYDQLAQELFWMDKTAVTLEQFFSPVTLNPGDVWQSTLGLGIFGGIKKIDAASLSGVFAFHPETMGLDIFPFENASLSITPHLKSRDGKTVKMLEEKSAILSSGFPLAINWPVPSSLSYDAVEFQVKEKGGISSFTALANAAPASGCKLPVPKKNPPPIIKGEAKKAEIAGAAVPAHAGTKIRILQLSTFQFERSQVDKNFSILESSRTALRALDGLKYFLREESDLEVDNAYETNFLDYLANLYSYDVLVLNDFRSSLLAPYVDDILKYVEKGHGLIILGGYASYGGRGKEFGDSKDIARLFPMKIMETPDWQDQSRYPAGTKGKYGAFIANNYTEATCETCGNLIRFYDGMLPIMEGVDWIPDGKRPETVKEGHPIVAGIPLASIAPSYHRVQAKEGAEVIARIGDNPVIVTQPLGKGRITGVAIADYRKMYFWKYAPQLYRQAVRWTAGKDAVPCIETVVLAPGQVSVEVNNPGGKEINTDLQVTVQGPDNAVLLRKNEPVSIPAGKRLAKKYPCAASLFALGGCYTANAKIESHAGEGLFYLEKNDPLKVEIKTHKHSYRRGEEICPAITLAKPEDVSKLTVEMIDSLGVTVAAKEVQPEKQSFNIGIPSGDFTYGKYKYVVKAYDGQGKISGAFILDIAVCKEPRVDFQVYYYGQLGDSTGTWETLAGVEYLLENCNIIFGPRLLRNSHYMPVVDRGYALGSKHIPWANNATLRGPKVEGKALSQRDPEKLKWTEEFLRKYYTGYESLSGVLGMYLDDEGGVTSYTSYDKSEFKKEYGFELPDKPVTLAERLALANYHAASMDIIYRFNADITKKINPAWKAYVLQSVQNCSIITGRDIEENFKDMDAVIYDIYPRSLFDIEYDLMFMNVLRCAGKRLKKPAYLTMQCVYGDDNVAKMQYWLLLGAGLEGYSWYSSNAILDERYGVLYPLNKFAREHGALFGQWDKPDSKIAILYADAMMSLPSYEDTKSYQASLMAVSGELYARDLYPDFVKEASINDGRVNQYDILIVADVRELEGKTTEKLEQFAKKKRLYCDAKTKISIPGSKLLDYEEIRGNILPKVETPDKKVFAEPLLAGGMEYIVVYNHNIKEVETEIIINQAAGINCVYEMVSRQKAPFSKKGSALTLQQKIPAVSGKIYALFENDPQQMSIVNLAGDKQATPGKTATVEIVCAPKQKGYVPVKVRVIQPNGEISAYGDTCVLSDGVLKFDVPFGINDQKGVWKIAAEEMISGRTAGLDLPLE